MAVPTFLFIDTSIFDGCAYNFDSASLKPIIKIAAETKLSLLMPNITRREILRHIKERSSDTLKALAAAQKKAPFLLKWNDWPLKAKHEYLLNYELNRIATNEFDKFTNIFKCISLDMKETDADEVMIWYEESIPPFGKGRKKAEFPDAFVLQSLIRFSEKETVSVAIISNDKDFHNACVRYDSLFCYKSVGAYAESLISNDEHLAKVKSILNSNSDIIAESIEDEFYELRFHATDEEYATFEAPKVNDIEFNDISIFGIGDEEVSVSFQALVSFDICSTYDQLQPFPGPDGEDDWLEMSTMDKISRRADIGGIAKLKVNPEWTSIENVKLARLDDEIIWIEAKHDDPRWD